MIKLNRLQKLRLAVLGALVIGLIASAQVWDLLRFSLLPGEPFWLSGIGAVAACALSCIFSYLATDGARL